MHDLYELSGTPCLVGRRLGVCVCVTYNKFCAKTGYLVEEIRAVTRFGGVVEDDTRVEGKIHGGRVWANHPLEKERKRERETTFARGTHFVRPGFRKEGKTGGKIPAELLRIGKHCLRGVKYMSACVWRLSNLFFGYEK